MMKHLLGCSSTGWNVVKCPLARPSGEYKGGTCLTTFCTLVPHPIQQVPFYYFRPFPSNILSPAVRLTVLPSTMETMEKWCKTAEQWQHPWRICNKEYWSFSSRSWWSNLLLRTLLFVFNWSPICLHFCGPESHKSSFLSLFHIVGNHEHLPDLSQGFNLLHLSCFSGSGSSQLCRVLSCAGPLTARARSSNVSFCFLLISGLGL